MSERAGGERGRGRLLPDVTINDDRVARLDARAREERAQRLGRQECLLLRRDRRERDAAGTRDVAGLVTPLGRTPRLCAVVERGKSGIDDRDIARLEILRDEVR